MTPPDSEAMAEQMSHSNRPDCCEGKHYEPTSDSQPPTPGSIDSPAAETDTLPTTEAERVDEALERAAEMVALDAKRQMGPIQTKEARNLAGWADAVKLLYCWHQEAYEDSDGSSLMPPVMHDGICDTNCGDPCKPCLSRRQFCDAMLGEEKDG